MPDQDSLGSVAKRGKTRRWNRRWAKICDDCGEPLIFLDNSQPPTPGKHFSPFVPVELYGTVNGEPAPWEGSIAFDPSKHAKHVCVRQRRRLAWILRQKSDDILD